ncbi:MAG TPA: S8 family serine peptidase, partial [Terriglobales bacterium]|nr:S8 family serine peptidase [Terriglobales bacterium]
GVWEGDFKSGGAATGVLAGAGTAHDFGGPTLFDTLVTSGGNPIILHWSDPLGSSSNDYDLYALNAAGTAIVAASTDAQTGTQDPLEGFNAPPAGSRLVIVKWSGADRFLHLNTFRGTLSKFTSGQTHGHSAVDSVGAYGVAATPALGPFGNSAAGPYPNGFNSSNQTETFESDGRRRIFYDNTGTAITPGNVSSTGGKLLNKPDITAADGVSVTGVGGFGSPFYGTSAASPHAGAIAALIKQALPGLTQTQFRNLLTSTAVDIGPAGFDINSGAGIIRAWNALFSGGATGTADIEPGTINAIENPGDGDGAINTGEGASVSIQLKSVGTQAANSVVGTLTSSTPGVTIFMPNATSYGNLAAVSGTGTKSFKFTVGSTVPCPAVLDFTLTVTYTGGPSPKLINFKVPIGTVPIAINGTLDATASPSTAYWTSTTGLQQGRLTRNGVASSCGSLKPFPGLLATTGDRRYDAYAFKTCANSVASCATVNLQGSGAASMFGVNYLGTFNPASISTNYLADPGISSGNISWSFPLGAGVQNFTTVVHEVNPGGATGQSYKLSITGACINSCVINHPPVAKAKDVTVTSGFGCVANANVNDGSYDPDPGDTITVTQNPPGPYPVGVTPVILTVTDSKGAFSQTTANVTVLAASQSSLSAAVIYVPPVKARITFTDLVYASCAKVAPTGTVTFTDTKTNTVLGTVPLSSSGKIGQATLTIERVRPVNMSVKATYSGDSATAGSSAGPKLVFAY